DAWRAPSDSRRQQSARSERRRAPDAADCRRRGRCRARGKRRRLPARHAHVRQQTSRSRRGADRRPPPAQDADAAAGGRGGASCSFGFELSARPPPRIEHLPSKVAPSLITRTGAVTLPTIMLGARISRRSRAVMSPVTLPCTTIEPPLIVAFTVA